jgi:phage gpG-like protein
MITPEQMLKNTTAFYAEIEKAKKMHVAVGLPVEKVGGKVYGDGMSIIRIGAIHEFGYGPIPRRSFLRVPFATKKAEIADALVKEFKAVSEGKRTATQALGRVGIVAENISRGAFTTRGYGEWPDIKAATKKRKGSSKVMIDTGILRGSITSVVRG